MTDTASDTIISPSGVEILKSEIMVLFDRITQFLDHNNTKVTAQHTASTSFLVAFMPPANNVVLADSHTSGPKFCQKLYNALKCIFKGQQTAHNNPQGELPANALPTPDPTSTGVSAELFKVCATICQTLTLESKHTGAFDATTPTNMFLKTVSDNTCNIIYSFDPVPHAIGDLSFLLGAVDNVLPKLASNVMGCLSGPVLALFQVRDKVGGFLNKLYPLMEYHHIGKIIYYSKAGVEPVALRDSCLINDDSVEQFRRNTVITQLPENDGTVQDVVDVHMFFPVAFLDLEYRLPKEGNVQDTAI